MTGNLVLCPDTVHERKISLDLHRFFANAVIDTRLIGREGKRNRNDHSTIISKPRRITRSTVLLAQCELGRKMSDLEVCSKTALPNRNTLDLNPTRHLLRKFNIRRHLLPAIRRAGSTFVHCAFCFNGTTFGKVSHRTGEEMNSPDRRGSNFTTAR